MAKANGKPMSCKVTKPSKGNSPGLLRTSMVKDVPFSNDYLNSAHTKFAEIMVRTGLDMCHV